MPQNSNHCRITVGPIMIEIVATMFWAREIRCVTLCNEILIQNPETLCVYYATKTDLFGQRVWVSGCVMFLRKCWGGKGERLMVWIIGDSSLMACIVWRDVGLNGMSLFWGNSACKIGEYTGQDPQSTHKQLHLYLLQQIPTALLIQN